MSVSWKSGGGGRKTYGEVRSAIDKDGDAERDFLSSVVLVEETALSTRSSIPRRKENGGSLLTLARR